MSLRGPRPRLASLAAGSLAAAFAALLVLLGSALPLRASDVTLPGPSDLCAAESGSTVTVRWASVTGADSYETRWAMVGGPEEVVDWSQETARTVSGAEDSMSSLATGTQWKVRVRAGVNAAFSTSSSELYFVVGEAAGCGSTGRGGLGNSEDRGDPGAGAATDTRLASLSIGGVDIGPFDSAKTSYRGEPDDLWTVRARAVRPDATVTIMPGDVDGDPSNGHQVDPQTVTEITVTVTSEDGLNSRDYRVRIERPTTPEQEAEDSAPTSEGTKPAKASELPPPRVSPGQVTVIGNTRSLGVSHRYDCRDDARHSLVGGWVDGTEVEMLGEGVGRCSGWFWAHAGDAGSWVRARFLVPSPAEALAMQAPPTRWIIGNTGGLGVSHRNVCLDAARLSVVGGLLDGAEVEVVETGTGLCAGWLGVRAGEVTTWVRARYVREYMPVPKWVIRNTGGAGVSHRNECDDGARLSAIGGWRDGTMVDVQAQGVGVCAGWLLVEAHDVTSWVRERYVERLSMPVVPATGGR